MFTTQMKQLCWGILIGMLLFPIDGFSQQQRQGNRKKSKQEQQRPVKQSRTLLNDKTKVVFLSDNGEDDTLILEEFYENAPKHFTAPGLPRFAIIGKNHKFYLGIGGYAKATASFDFGNPIDNPMYFTTSTIPMHQTPGNGGLFQMSAGTSNIFFNFIALPGSKHKLGAYINFNLANPDYGFDLQNLYLTYGGFTAGYKFSMMYDELVSPPTIDQEGPSSMAAVEQTVANYTYRYKNWQFAIGIEAPQVSITTNSYTALVNQRIPDIPAYVQYGWDKGNSTVRLSGILRNIQYRDLVAEKNCNITGWGVQLTGLSTVTRYLNLYYQAIYGNGISNIMQDVDGLGLDLTPNPDQTGKLKGVRAWGTYGGFQINFTKKIFSSHTYSQVRNYASKYDDSTNSWNSKYKYAQYLVNNVFWQPSPTIQVGIEYLWGRLAIMDGTTKCDHRIQTMMQFSF